MLFIIVLLASGTIFYYRFYNRADLLYCSPNSPRGNDIITWKNILNPPPTSIHMDPDFLNNFTVSSEPASFTVKYPSQMPQDNPFAVDLSELSVGESLEIGGGTLEYQGTGVAYYDVNQSMDMDADYRFYDAESRLMTETRMQELGIYNTIARASNFRYNPWPAVQFMFEHHGIEDIKFHSIKVFDARTHTLIGSGGSSYGSPNSYRFQTYVPLWHRAPVDVVIELSYGPSKIYEFAPKAGEGFQNEESECRLLHIFEGVDPYTSSSESGETGVTERIHKDTRGDPGVCFFFVCQPQASGMPVSFEFLDKDGNQLRTHGSSMSDFTHRITLKEPLSKVSLIRARYRTKRQRVVMHLPYIPGLPEQNNNVNDLLDVHIPYVRIDNSGQVSQFLRKTLQLSHSSISGLSPQNSFRNYTFPMDFRDVTVRDVAKFYSTGGTLNIDIENDKLELQYPVPFRLKLAQFLQKIFNK